MQPRMKTHLAWKTAVTTVFMHLALIKIWCCGHRLKSAMSSAICELAYVLSTQAAPVSTAGKRQSMRGGGSMRHKIPSSFGDAGSLTNVAYRCVADWVVSCFVNATNPIDFLPNWRFHNQIRVDYICLFLPSDAHAYSAACAMLWRLSICSSTAETTELIIKLQILD